MEGKLFRAAAWFTWLALPLTAFNYWRSWDCLPGSMAVHFDINWQPNGWTSREGSLVLALGTTIIPLVIFSISSYVVGRRASVSGLSKWAMVVVFYTALCFVYLVNNWIVDRNLNSRPTPFGELIVFPDFDAIKAGGTLSL
jgi:uncharacterized membrane protein YhdT